MLLQLLACSRGATDCASLDDQVERDLCIYEGLQVSAPADPAAAAVELARIEDPVVRSAAVLGWLRDHPKAGGNGAARLCELLNGVERMSCERRASSPHLHR